MKDAQSATTELKSTIDDDRACSRMSFIAELKTNRDVFSNLPEMIEQWLEKQTRTTTQFDTTEQGMSTQKGSNPHLLEHFKKLQQQFKSSNDEYIKELCIKEEQIKKSRERITWLENELKSTKSVSTAASNGDHEESFRSTQKLEEEYQAVISKKDEELEELRGRLVQMENENYSIKARGDEGLKELQTRFMQTEESYQTAISIKDDQLSQLHFSLTQLNEKCRTALAKKEEELMEVKNRLALLSEKLVRKDQRKVEDTASANRPSEVEEAFREFFDHERVDSMDKMQEVYGSEEEHDLAISYPRLACLILEAAFEEMTEAKESVLDVFKVMVNSMIELAPRLGQEHCIRTKEQRLPYRFPARVTACSPGLNCPPEVLDALVLSLKETAHLCSIESMETNVEKKIKEKWRSWLIREKACNFTFSEHLLSELKNYIKACMRITWQMVTQVPPMQLEYKSATLSKIHKNVGYHSSLEMCSRSPPNEQASTEESEIACYLWPALLDGGGRLIRAGEVLCKVKVEEV